MTEEDRSMKVYDEKSRLTGVVCNCCGKLILKDQDIFKEDYVTIQKEWGYFSDKDGIKDEFELCEACYDRITGSFLVPVKAEEMTELL